MGFSVSIAWLLVLSFNNLKLHRTKAMKNILRQEKIKLRLTLNPGLAFEQPGPGEQVPDCKVH